MIPLILLTSAGQKGKPDNIVKEMFEAYLVKPARSSMLLDSILNSLKEGAVKRAAATSAKLAAKANEAGIVPLTNGCPFTEDGSALDVLVAEDNMVNQMVITAMLKKLGCKPRMTANGQEAIDAYRVSVPDIILMDISMPVMDGIKATDIIRKMQEDSAAHTPIVGVTAHALKEDRDRCINAGMDGYLPKPVRQDALEEVLTKWAPNAGKKATA